MHKYYIPSMVRELLLSAAFISTIRESKIVLGCAAMNFQQLESFQLEVVTWPWNRSLPYELYHSFLHATEKIYKVSVGDAYFQQKKNEFLGRGAVVKSNTQ